MPPAEATDFAALLRQHRRAAQFTQEALSERPGEPAPAALLRVLRDRRLLLGLDNCEHLLDACARLADDLLRRCPELLILATSREALGLAGEVVRPLAPLAAPPGPPRRSQDLTRCRMREHTEARNRALNRVIRVFAIAIPRYAAREAHCGLPVKRPAPKPLPRRERIV